MFWNTFFTECQNQGTSPNAVCKEIGLSNAAATGWKKGTSPKADALCKIADYLGVSVDYLLGRQNETAPVENQSGDGAMPSESEWMQILSQMSHESLIQLRDYTRYLLWKQAQVSEDSQ